MAGPFLFGNSPPFYSVYGPASATAPGFLTNGAQSILGPKTWITAHVDASAENPLAMWRLDEDTSASFSITNAVSTNGVFVPGIVAISTGTRSGFIQRVDVTTDSGGSGCTVWNTRLASSAAVVNRTILYEWDNNGTAVMQMSPAGGLQISGGTAPGLTIGSSGTKITQTKVYSQTITPASVAANTTAEQTFTVTGLTTADKVTLNPGAAPTAGTGIVGVRVSAADTLAVTYCNNTAGALTPVSSTCLILATRS